MRTFVVLVTIAVHLAASAELFRTDFSGSNGYSSEGGASSVYDNEFGRNVLQLDGINQYALVPAVRFQETDFTIEMWFKTTANNKRQVLIGDWSKPWQFLIEVTASGEIEVTLRRNINSAGSDPKQNLLTARGGTVEVGQWQYLQVKYAHGPGTCLVYLNDVEVAQSTTTYTDHNLQVNTHEQYEIGYKKDSNSDYFKGRIGFLRILNEVFNLAAPAHELYHTEFSGPTDHIESISEGASFVFDSELNKLVLELNGTGYAHVPAVKFQKQDFTIEMWFKSIANGKRQVLFADWSKPWQFIIAVKADGKIQVDLRRNINSAGSDPKQNLIEASGGSVTRGVWQHLVVTYWHVSGTCVIYLNDQVVSSLSTTYPDHDLQVNDHPTYEVGYKKDGNSDFFKGRIALLSVDGNAYNLLGRSAFPSCDH
ncbi:uncharacterized protein LOC135501582 [Lineus longissimus]|uniref:uncharacterized protein LOC135501582 n=1 Tax=Lineus longissimus TaxID=88925 RepID=UPI002B4CCC38